MSVTNPVFIRAVALGVSNLVEAALWIAAIDALPAEERGESVNRWLRAVDSLDLWRLAAEAELRNDDFPDDPDRRR